MEAATLTVASQNSCTLFPFEKEHNLTTFFLEKTCAIPKMSNVYRMFFNKKEWQIWGESDPESVFSPDAYCVLYNVHPCNIIS